MTKPDNPPRDESPSGKRPIDKSGDRLRMYGRAGGRPLSARRAGLADTLMPVIGIPKTPPAELDPANLYDTPKRQHWLEIGFGGGEHLAGQAAKNPDIGIMGAEPFIEGVGKLLSAVDDDDLQNVRLWRGDARELVDQIAPTTIDRVFILFPDPWPKSRHHKRRIVQPKFLNELARILKPGAQLRFATDVADYANRALADIRRDGRYEWTAKCADDWRVPPEDHVTTRYQTKRLGDCPPVFYDFVFQPK